MLGRGLVGFGRGLFGFGQVLSGLVEVWSGLVEFDRFRYMAGSRIRACLLTRMRVHSLSRSCMPSLMPMHIYAQHFYMVSYSSMLQQCGSGGNGGGEQRRRRQTRRRPVVAAAERLGSICGFCVVGGGLGCFDGGGRHRAAADGGHGGGHSGGGGGCCAEQVQPGNLMLSYQCQDLQRSRGHLIFGIIGALACAAVAVGAARGISGLGGATEAVNDAKVR